VGSVGAALLCVVALLATYSLGLSRKLKKQVATAEGANQSLQYANAQLRVQLDEINRLQSILHEQAIRDALTQLHNRRYMAEHLPTLLLNAQRAGHPLTVAMLDLDHFKHINDTYGHVVGDEVLKHIAGFIRSHIGKTVSAYRYGGEEFLLVFPRLNAEQTLVLLQGWQKQSQAFALKHGELEISLTFSVGIAAYPTHGTDIDALVAAADRALYKAKTNGRNCCSLA
jgi:diguanylate cyclase (GGDEF)-like protein